MFIGVHMMMAQRLNTPELAITPDEGIAFMTAAQNVLRHYSVEATQKTLDWIAFAGIGGGMYLTRGVAISQRLGQERAERQAAGERGQVIRFRRPGREAAPAPAGGGEGSGLPPGAIVGGAQPLDIVADHLGTQGFQAEHEPA